MKININYKALTIYALVFLLIFSTDTFMVFANQSEIIKRCFQIVLLMLLLYLIIRIPKMSNNKIIIFIVLVIPIILSSWVNHDFSGGNIIKIFLLTLGWFVTSYISFDEFKMCFCNIMYLIAIVSLPLYLCTEIIIQYSDYLPVITNIGNNSVAFFGLTNVRLAVQGIPRNYGPFWEPGVYATYLNMALLLLLKDAKGITKKEIVLILGILSTLSTAGIIIMLIIIFDYIYLQKEYISKQHRIKRSKLTLQVISIVLVIAMFVFMLSNEDIRTMVFAKLNRQDFRFMSTSARLTSITGNISIWAQHPILGVGSGNIENLYITFLKRNGYSPNSNTNGLLMHYSMYGVFMGTTVTYCLYKYSKKVRCNRLSAMTIFVVILMMLAAEPLVTSALFNVILFYGLTDRKSKGLIKK